jgi:actin-related protein 6
VQEQLYVLPEQGDLGHKANAGEDLAGKQVLNLSNLAITVPELIFRPSDAGIQCGGLHEAILQTLAKVPSEIREELTQNIVLIGGLAQTKGIEERLRQELDENLPSPAGISTGQE